MPNYLATKKDRVLVFGLGSERDDEGDGARVYTL
jgi:hypothetical protein